MRECYINGFRTVDLTFRPLILFPRLSPSDGWTDAKPALGIIQQLYLEQLKLAIDALNTAGIAHLDLRPANALWREIHNGDTPSVELRLIDFEDAVPFGQVIPPELVRVIVDSDDYRYPFQSGDEHSDQIARVLHNEFFFEAIGRWTSSEVIEFTEFMQDGTGLEILHSLLAP
jgi:serine/threonine protein kinase